MNYDMKRRRAGTCKLLLTYKYVKKTKIELDILSIGRDW